MKRSEKRKEIQLVRPRVLTGTSTRLVEYSVEERTVTKLVSGKKIVGPWRIVSYEIRKQVG